MELNASVYLSLSDPKRTLQFFLRVAVFISLLVFLSNTSYAAEIDCLMCHESLIKEKVIHQAIHMGCTICHSAMDAGEIPHKIKNKAARGLSSEQPELCYACHDKAKFTNKTVHAAISMGCTVCHNPHSSKNAKLLLSGQPDLCYTCHDKTKFNGKFMHAPVVIGLCMDCHAPHRSENEKLLLKQLPDLCYTCHDVSGFNKKNVHMPVAGGMCLSCHNPHASENEILFRQEPVDVCFDCHEDIKYQPHVVSGGHPIGIAKKDRKIDDPLRTGKQFYCGSCHNPHSSDAVKLFRYKVKGAFELCLKCHNK